MPNPDNETVVRAAYTAFKAGDVPTVLGQLAPSVEWQLPNIPGARISGRRQGIDQVRDFFGTLAADQEVVSFEPRQFIVTGDTVVALGDYEWRVRSTGKSFKSDFSHTFKVRDGKVVSFNELLDSNAAAEAYRK